MLTPFELKLPSAVRFGPGSIALVGALAAELGFRRTLLVADQGLVAVGHVSKVAALLAESGIDPVPFHDFGENPDSNMVEHGRVFAESSGVDSMLALGGGSSMDSAKGINFVLTNGGRIQDYWGHGKASKPMLPMIGVPTTTGTGSEAQSYAIISDADTHRKLACGDPKAAFAAVILDPELALSQPQSVRAVTGYDAISHAVETFVTTKRSPISVAFAREAWRLLNGSYERALMAVDDLEAIAAMQLGSFYAGIAIEHSMLGAAHACANPLTQRYGTVHGVAIAQMLAHVVRWNMAVVRKDYEDLHSDLPERLRDLAQAAQLPCSIGRDTNEDDILLLAEHAADQWTGRFNPRPFDRAAAESIYRAAWQ